MEQNDLISFTSVIAGMLLCKRVLTSSEIVNFISELNCEGMEIDDYWNNEELFPIVNMDSNYYFRLRDDFSYDTVLPCGITVRDFLYRNTDKRVLSVICGNQKYSEMYSKNYCLSNCDDNDNQKPSLEVFYLDGSEEKKSIPKVKKRSFLYSLWAEIH